MVRSPRLRHSLSHRLFHLAEDASRLSLFLLPADASWGDGQAGGRLDLVTVVTAALPASHKNVFSGFGARDLRFCFTGVGGHVQRG